MNQIPEYCPRCALKVIFWNATYGHTIQVWCDTYFTMLESLANFSKLLGEIQDLNSQLNENENLSVHYIQDKLENFVAKYGQKENPKTKGVWIKK